MTTHQGFGKVQPRKKTGKGTAKRQAAAKQYENMKTEGVPEFNIYIRIEGKRNWYPVGAIAVKRTSRIHDAIFANEEELRQGGYRLFPIIRKNQHQLEFGYKLKDPEFADEPIQVAVRPSQKGNFIQDAIARLKNSFSGLRERSAN